jgi:hypothetical protein
MMEEEKLLGRQINYVFLARRRNTPNKPDSLRVLLNYLLKAAEENYVVHT